MPSQQSVVATGIATGIIGGFCTCWKIEYNLGWIFWDPMCITYFMDPENEFVLLQKAEHIGGWL